MKSGRKLLDPNIYILLFYLSVIENPFILTFALVCGVFEICV
jgi:hypothetical protein